MPIYEYMCGACGHQMEAIQKMSEDPLTECPECKKAALQKLVSAAGFQLKGTGWYVTDFRNKGKPEGQSDNKTISTGSGKSNSSSSDSSSSSSSTSSTDSSTKGDKA